MIQAEIGNLDQVLKPTRPFVAVTAGSKYDTKIEPLSAIYAPVDHLILSGGIYNTYLCAKYGVKIARVGPEDITAAQNLVELDKIANKVLELPLLVESEMLGRQKGKYHTVSVADLKPGQKLGYVLDTAIDQNCQAARILSLRRGLDR
ncbi:hypothetical protein DFAR_2310025 [Desulfarculales bacterium]